jgi:polysaccharide biosynthesis transport protein
MWLGFSFSLWRERTDRTVRLPKPLVDRLHVDFVAVVPLVKIEAERRRGALAESAAAKHILQIAGMHGYALAEPDSAFARAIWCLKLGLGVDMPTGGKPPLVVGIAAFDEGAGRSVIATNLARILVRGGAPSLLVDADVHRASLSRALTPEARQGLLAETDDDFDEALWIDPTTEMRFLPLGEAGNEQGRPRDPLDALNRFAELRHHLPQQSYRIVVVTLPSFKSGLDAGASMRVVDRVILTVEWGKGDVDKLDGMIDRVPGLRQKLIGVALNKTDLVAIRNYDPNYYGDIHYAETPRLATPREEDKGAQGALVRQFEKRGE